MWFWGSRSNSGISPHQQEVLECSGVLGMVLGVRMIWGSHLVSRGPRGQQALGQVVLQVAGTGVGPPGQQQPHKGLLAGGPRQCCCHVQGGVPVGLGDMRGLRAPKSHPPEYLRDPRDLILIPPAPQTLHRHPKAPSALLIPRNRPEPLHPHQATRGAPKRVPQTPPNSPQRPQELPRGSPAPSAPQSPPQSPQSSPSPTSPSNLHVDKAGGHARLAQQEVGQGKVASPHGQVQGCQAAFGVLGARQGSGGAPQGVPPPYNLLNLPKGTPRDPRAWELRSPAHRDPEGRHRGLWGAPRCCGVSPPSPTLPRYPSGPQWPGAQLCPAHWDLEVGHSHL